MKRLTTVLCSLLFTIAGVCLALTSRETSASNIISAATPMPQLTQVSVPLDLQLDMIKHASTDTVFIEKHDTIYTKHGKVRPVSSKHKNKKKSKSPDKMTRKVTQDTLYVPAFYIVVPLEHLHESKDSLIIAKD